MTIGETAGGRAWIAIGLCLGLTMIGWSAGWAIGKVSSDDCTAVTSITPDGAVITQRTCS